MKEKELEQTINLASQAEESGNFLAASAFYKEGLRYARELGDSEQIKFLKHKTIEINKKSIPLMTQHKYKQDGNFLEIKQELREAFSNTDLFTCLCIIGANNNFLLSYKDTLEAANKTKPVSTMLANYQTISSDGHLVEGGDDPSYCWFMELYKLVQEKVILPNLYIALELLKKRRGKIDRLTSDNLVKFLIASRFVSNEQIDVIKKGVERFFLKDYISALHILIPNLEKLFLDLGEKAGIDVVALNSRTHSISTQRKVLSERLLLSKEFVDIWGEDFCYQYTIVFYDPLGYMLRHKCAHGNISTNECHENFANLVVYFYLALISRFYLFTLKNKDNVT